VTQQLAQDAANVGTIWIEFFKSGLPGIAIVVGAIGTFLTSAVAAYKSIRNGQKATKIQEQTNGNLSKLRDELAEERAARREAQEETHQVQQELSALYAILSARMKQPVADIRAIVRHTDLLPGIAPLERRTGGNGNGQHPMRRRTDPPAATERKDDTDTDS
jgi:signal transduction histidine kinase